MKFLCLECDEQMGFEERQEPGDGTFAAAFRCPHCGRGVAMLANPMETQLVGSLGVKIGGSTLDGEPMAFVRDAMITGDAALEATPDAGPARVRPRWSAEGEARLARVPGFVRGMVKRIYVEWASERGIEEITPAIMDQARSDLGLEGM